MKRFLCSIIMIFACNFSFSQTQLEMNESAKNKFLKADKELNRVYQQVLREYKSDTTFIRNLKTSQRLWVQFRAAEMEMMYPDRDPGHYGSIHPMCWFFDIKELTLERIKKLRAWLDGQAEGDSCTPSIKVNNNIHLS